MTKQKRASREAIDLSEDELNRVGDADDENYRDLNLAVKALRDIAFRLESSRVSEYLSVLDNPRRLLWRNFGAGIARGIGFTIGFAVLGAITVIVLKTLVDMNLPIIGDFIAEVLYYVEQARS